MWDVKTIAEDLLHCRDLQEFINRRYRDKDSFIVRRDAFKFVGTDYGIFRFDDDANNTIPQVDTDYITTDIMPSDIVLDVGANIGAFSVKTARKARYVYAVEPLITEQLKYNVRLNRLDNIKVMDHALGSGTQKIEWGLNNKLMDCKSLSEIISLCGGRVDFLKCDCEGGEWCIGPEELTNIRRIEIEVHNWDKSHKFSDFTDMLAEAGFSFTTAYGGKYCQLVHASNHWKSVV